MSYLLAAPWPLFALILGGYLLRRAGRGRHGISLMSYLLAALWPLFALILGGYLLRRAGFPSNAFWPGAERLNYFVLFPALLFSSLARAPLDSPHLGRIA